LQFIVAFKKLLVHTQISNSKYANCLSQDNTSFLQLLSAKSTSDLDDISIQDYNINSYRKFKCTWRSWLLLTCSFW